MLIRGIFLSIVAAALLPQTIPAAETAWEQIKLPEAAAKRALYDVCFAGDKNGWIVGEGGLCLMSGNGGKTWKVLETGSKAILRRVCFTDALKGWTCGDGDPDVIRTRGFWMHNVWGAKKIPGTLLATEDGGKTWTPFGIPTNFKITSLDIGNVPSVFLVSSAGKGHPDGDGIILRETKKGKMFLGIGAYRALCDVVMVGERRWVAVGSPVSVKFTPSPKTTAYTSRRCRALYTDKKWAASKGTEGMKGGWLRGLAFREGLPLIAVGDKGHIFTSEDKGSTWEAVKSGTDASLLRVTYGPGNKPALVAVGRKGTVLCSRDLGKTWQALPAPVKDDLRGIAPAGTDFFAVGGKGKLLRIIN